MNKLILFGLLIFSFHCFSQNDSLIRAKFLLIRSKVEINSADVKKQIITFQSNSKSKLQTALSEYLWGMYFMKSDLDKSKMYFNTSLQRFKDIGDKKGQIMGLSALSNIEFFSGNYDKVINTSLKCITLLDKEKDVYNIANLNNNIASAFLQLYDFEKSKRYYGLALKGYEKTGDTNGIVICNRKIASIYFNQDDFDNAKIYYEKAELLSFLTEDFSNLSSCYVGQGNIYFEKGDFQNSYNKYRQSVDLIEETGLKCDLMYSLPGLADASIQLKKYQEARMYLLQSLELDEDCSIEIQKPEIYRLLFEVSFKLNDFEEAIKYLAISDSLKLQLNFENVRKEAEELETKYQTAQKDKSILQKELKINKMNQKFWFVLTFSFVLIGLVLITFFVYRKQRKLSASLQDSNQMKDLIFTVIGHDLRAPISSLLIDQSVSDSVKMKANLALEIMDELLIYGKSKSFVSEKNKVISTQLILDELEDEHNLQIHSKMLQIERDEMADLELKIPKEQWRIVCRNLFSNAIKYSENGTKIKVKMDSKSFQISNFTEGRQSNSTQVGHLIVASICKDHKIDFMYENKDNLVVVKLGIQ